ncbi:MAG: glycosyltransferase family 2 protein [Candidatus Zixiibacteriota bacterium]|nr:MAG: glycosyltransferase family 2 protein [candidate division Zixibacteria bacterium]
MSRISCVIITYNESKNIKRCLESVSWTDEIVVVDSYSTDDTREIASAFTDKIHQLKWSGFGPAKECAKSKATGDWILSVDADEVVSGKLREEIQGITESQGSLDSYFIPRRSNFLGRWIRHGGWYPDLVLRLFRKEKGGFTDRVVHEEVKVSGSTGRLKNDLLHYTDPDLDHYLKKLNRYTTLDALQLFREGRGAGVLDILFRPILTLVKMYFFKLGFLDGVPGLILAVSSSFHVFSKYVKLWHLRETTGGEGREDGPPV